MGEGVEEDKVQAVVWYQRFAEQGNALGNYTIRLPYFDGYLS